MRRRFSTVLVLALGASGLWLSAWFLTRPRMKILSPLDGTLFPADLRSPELAWDDPDPTHKVWRLRFSFQDPKQDLEVFAPEPQWTPGPEAWERIKAASRKSPASLEVRGLQARDARPGPAARAGFSTSPDPVGAPILYRAVPNPFPAPPDFVKVKWMLGSVSSYDPPRTIMKNQSQCLNCHVTSFDGKSFGFEINPRGTGSDRSNYLVFRDPGRTVVLDRKNLLDWNDYLPASQRQGHEAFGSAISPDGDTYVTCGKAMQRVLFDPCADCINYTLLTKGILLFYSVKNKVIKALPGADDERFVQVPSSWSPDGRFIYFHRAPITPQYEKLNREPMDPELQHQQGALGWRELDKLYPMKYDVYRIPFNGGRGGTPTPVEGASRNGRSNANARVSPDGKWIVFTQTANGLLLIRPDSELHIVPAAGGKARRLRSNLPGANSAHSWSPNSRWLVFSHKPSFDTQTDLVLTHIDEDGKESPPLVLTHLRDAEGLSANIPEFVALKPGQMERIVPRLEGR